MTNLQKHDRFPLVSHMPDDSVRRLCLIETAEKYLMDYRDAGSIIPRAERERLRDLIEADITPADAAEIVQAETWQESRP